MMHFRSARTALILLLLSLIALENTIALSQRDIAADELNNAMLNEEPSGMNSKWKRSGRKMAMEVNTAALNTGGGVKSSSGEPSLQSSGTEDISHDLKNKLGNRAMRVAIKDRVQVTERYYSSRHGSLRSSSQVLKLSEKQKLIEASDEVFKMLNRDYDLHPRRHPPVHN